MTGNLFGTVKDAQGGVLPGALVRINSPALIGNSTTQTTNEKGQPRFLALPRGGHAGHRVAGISGLSPKRASASERAAP